MKRLLLYALPVLLVLAVLVSYRYFDGSQKPNFEPSGSSIKVLVSACRLARADKVFPGKSEEVLNALNAVTLAASNERKRMWGFRDYSQTDTAYASVSDAAIHLASDCVKHRKQYFVLSRDAIRDASVSLEQATKVSKLAVQMPEIREHLAQSTMTLSIARGRFDASCYDEALDYARLSQAESMKAYSLARKSISRFNDSSYLGTWATWMQKAIDLSKTGRLTLLVVKELHELRAYRGGKVLQTFKVDLGAGSLYQKMKAGDRATPEGLYKITEKNPYSKYYKALLIDYPNTDDRNRFRDAVASGDPSMQDAEIGSMIEIHGDGGRGVDWTDGCLAPSNEDMEWLYKNCPVGTPVAIVGSDGTIGPLREVLK